jgi:hypothetical protein
VLSAASHNHRDVLEHVLELVGHFDMGPLVERFKFSTIRIRRRDQPYALEDFAGVALVCSVGSHEGSWDQPIH